MTNAEITLREVYDLMVEVRDDVTSLKAVMTDTKTDVADHESRIRILEKLVWKVAGAATILGAVIGFGVDKLLNV